MRFTPLILVLCASTAACLFHRASTGAFRSLAISGLTVPPNRLPTGCALVPSPTVRLTENRFQGGLWADLPISSNPWSGMDRQVVASIRERLDGPFLVPDGPPPSGRDLARYRSKLAEGVDEAYAAIYKETGSTSLIVVLALRFSSTAELVTVGHPSYTLGSTANNPNRMTIGPTTIAVTANAGICSRTIEAYLKSLAQRASG